MVCLQVHSEHIEFYFFLFGAKKKHTNQNQVFLMNLKCKFVEPFGWQGTPVLWLVHVWVLNMQGVRRACTTCFEKLFLSDTRISHE
jgi:hypothetical protein